MTRRYDAFLIRHWALDSDNGQRAEIVHIQSGAKTLVTSLPRAIDWMQSQIADLAADTPTTNLRDSPGTAPSPRSE